MISLPSWLHVLAGAEPQTPLQLTMWLLWVVFGLAMAVGIVYVFLLIWSLGKHLSHEPIAQYRQAPTRASAKTPPPVR